jgi:drug/metabolite transporter (DMT)-like permease
MRLTRRWGPVTAGYVAMIFHAICGGAYWPVQKDLARHIRPADLNWLQMVVGLAIMLPICAVRYKAIARTRTPWQALLVFGALATIIFYTRTVGIDITTAGTAVILTRSEVVFSILLAYLLLGQYITGWGWLGAALLSLGSFMPLVASGGEFSFATVGVVALLICSIGVAINGVIIKRFFMQTSNELVVLASALCQAGILSICILPHGIPPSVGELLRDPRLRIELLLSVVFILGMLYLYYYALERISLPSARVLALMIPTVAVLGEHVWLGTPLGVGQVTGVAMVTVGALLVILLGNPGQVRSVAAPGDAA